MKNIKLTISFDGANFHGFQRQVDKRTVQEELEKAIYKVTKEKVNIIPCGRTDAGVHAYKHIVNFRIETSLPGQAFKYKLRKYIADDIKIIEAEEVDYDFHARFDAKNKTYRYVISREDYPFYRNYKTYVKYDLDINKIKEAAKKLEGLHDFRAFMKWSDYKKEEVNSVRSIDKIVIVENLDDIYFEFTGQSFLHNQIRIMSGLLIDIGRGFRDISYIDEIFEGKVTRAAKTYGPQGLYLMDVSY
ncbi:tRNA pseudouridine(38-40) synthase TruA [Helcococcus massiliensis]|uniref:tRNA pseudouridine(38-40) synthase TruA n=1 Tax=Helcococcus massiliensis TaxID=2040290 RepID=UPI000CDE76FB|nr:tRNA pseudouridine(38-40) synthase TruA [Helcococcus massiliensis]